jgi:integrase
LHDEQVRPHFPCENVRHGPQSTRLGRIRGGHERTIPISDSLAEALLDRAAGYVFPSLDRWGKPLGTHLTSHHLGKLVAAALPGTWTTHALRHRFGTMAYQGTHDIRVVQELLGHASPITTAIYTKVDNEAMRRAVDAARLVDHLSPMGTE